IFLPLLHHSRNSCVLWGYGQARSSTLKSFLEFRYSLVPVKI
ncbi:unnamed protein product, partial [Linum tenue]